MEEKRRPRWINVGVMFEHDVDGHPVLTGGLFGRQCVAIKTTSKQGEPMWSVCLLNVGKDHDAAIALAEHLIAKTEDAKTEKSPKHKTLKLNPMLETRK